MTGREAALAHPHETLTNVRTDRVRPPWAGAYCEGEEENSEIFSRAPSKPLLRMGSRRNVAYWITALRTELFFKILKFQLLHTLTDQRQAATTAEPES